MCAMATHQTALAGNCETQSRIHNNTVHLCERYLILLIPNEVSEVLVLLQSYISDNQS